MFKTHLQLGNELELFFFHPLSPGSCFFLPKGALICRKLEDCIRQEYKKEGYQEVDTPNIFHVDLWKKSGHWDHYREHMFSFHEKTEDHEKDSKTDSEASMYSLKPMNCPSHCLMFKYGSKSYRDLPVRYADFGVLHRNEFSGSLSGLSRVRKFRQDDAHIFCMLSQVKDEISKFFKMLERVYFKLGFKKYRFYLSTRPDKFIGDSAKWEKAELALKEALEQSGLDYTVNEKDGAFYGPKIDIMLEKKTVDDKGNVNDTMIQCATVQLDFMLPERFELEYVDEKANKQRPVIIHRAILGSIERMLSVLLEHHQGRLPMSISPRQVIVLPIKDANNEYAEKVKDYLVREGLEAEADLESQRIDKKVLKAENLKFNHILVVGGREEKNKMVNLRSAKKEYSLEDIVSYLKHDL